MANQEHLDILKQGVEVWNQWRENNPHIRPDLFDARLAGAYLSSANLQYANMVQVQLAGANLSRANLLGADLHGAILTRANLREANLNSADAFMALLEGAILEFAGLSVANLASAKLVSANLTGASLHSTNLSGADLRDADLSYCIARRTIFADTDLSLVRGLETVDHIGPSTVGIDTIYRSKGRIPEVFLRGAGVPEDFIHRIPSLLAQPFHSCFISYSSKDQDFAERLYEDLQGQGVRCWFAPEDMRIGARIRPAIDEAIHRQEKLLLILSESSIGSQWVEQEVETALEKERQEGPLVLFPIRLDDAVLREKAGWASLLKKTRHIGDFRQWEDDDTYQKAFARLLRVLRVQNGVGE